MEGGRGWRGKQASRLAGWLEQTQGKQKLEIVSLPTRREKLGNLKKASQSNEEGSLLKTNPQA